MDSYIPTAFVIVALGWFAWQVYGAVNNLYFSNLSKFPGPRLAGATGWWKAIVEGVLNQSFCHKLEGLHSQYGKVVRVGPNELHFSNPTAYHEIYNNANRWDKDHRLYHAFNEDRSSFGFTTYREAKERKDVLNKMFSPKAVDQVKDLILEKIDALCKVYEDLAKQGKPVDLNWSLRCLTVDVITYICFGKSVDAIHDKDFKSPLIVAMDTSMPIFVRFRYFKWYKNMIMNCPPKISRVVSPETAGLVDLQQILGEQIKDLKENPQHIENLPHNMTIFNHLMNKEAYKTGTVPSSESLYEEAQALMFAGADTSGSTMMVAFHHLLHNPSSYKKLKQELLGVWPKVTSECPSIRTLERLPYLNAVLKEALRLTGGVVSGLLRIVPPGGAKIDDVFVPEGTSVSCGSTFVHLDSEIFPEPYKFRPERWLENPDLDQWLVAFSRGPRSCLGLNLAWQEMRFALTHILRRFDMKLDPSSPEELRYHDTFLPFYVGPHLTATLDPVTA